MGGEEELKGRLLVLSESFFLSSQQNRKENAYHRRGKI